MSITTYSELQTAVQNWLARSDLSTYVPDFITLFETAANRRLRVRQQELSSVITMTSGSATLPTDYLAWRKVVRSGSSLYVVLEYVEPDFISFQGDGADLDQQRQPGGVHAQ
jgi:hypothetical protein